MTFPKRGGERPAVTSGIPHVQLDQTSSKEMFGLLTDWAFSQPGVVESPSRASLPGTRALSLAPGLEPHDDAMIVGREFAHIHPMTSGSGSLHLRLPSNVAQEVVDTGWGEWHPFALEDTMPDLVMVYSPRSDDDLDVVKTIITAAVAFASANDV